MSDEMDGVQRVERGLILSKRALWFCWGGGVSLVATAFDIRALDVGFNFWYGLWVVFLLLAMLLGVTMLVNFIWPGISLHERLNTAYGYFLNAWVILVSAGIRIGGLGGGELIMVAFVLAIFLGLSYWLLRRLARQQAEEMFP